VDLRQITDPAGLEACFAVERFLLFKHSPTCGVSRRVFKDYEAFAAAHPEVPTAWVDVLALRADVRDLARRIEIRHESPQAYWIVAGAVVWHASHFDLTRATLETATVA